MPTLKSRLPFVPALLMVVAGLSAQQKKPLTHDDYDQWRSLRGQAFSLDGAWVAYQYEPQFGDGLLEIKQAAGDRVYQQPLGSGPRFTADGRFVVFTIGTSKVAERDKKIDELRKKAKEGNKAGGATGEGEGEAAEGGAERSAAAARRAGGPPAGLGGRGAGGGRRPGGPAGAGAGGDGDEGTSRERGELAVLDLATGAVEKLGKTKGSLVSDDVPFLLYHREKPEAKKPATDEGGEAGEKPASGEGGGETKPAGGEVAGAAKPATEPATGGETKSATEPAAAGGANEATAREGRRGGRRGQPGGGAAAGGGRGGPPADPLEQKRPEGTDLVVRNLADGTERTIADVVAYGLSRQGKWLWYHTSAKKPAPEVRYGLFLQSLAGGEAIQLLDGVAHVGNVTIDRAEQVVAFTSDKEDFAADKPASDVYLWENGGAVARRIVHATSRGMPEGKRVGGGVSFSRDGSVLSFTVQNAPEAEPLPILPEDKVTLDLWNWRDGIDVQFGDFGDES